MINREELVTKLKDQDVTVHFTKVNGEKRIMTCTLREDVLPPAKKDDALSQKKIRELNPEVLSVWDVNAEGWRSFRVANVTKVE